MFSSSTKTSRLFTSSVCVSVTLLLSAAECTFADPLAPPFDTQPFNADAIGNSASNFEGFFRRNGGPQQFRIFIGTNDPRGSLILDFATLFTDGPGNDFAILTNDQSWGPLADVALFEFFLGNTLQTSFTASLAPDRLFEFELPGSGVVANRVVVTDITPDPPGINDLATMTFDNAGVSHPTPEPSSLLLLVLGLAGAAGYGWRRN